MRIGNTEITFKVGDLTKESADILVNAANNQGWMGGGVAAALKRTGGDVVEKEAVDRGPVNVGQAIVTQAGDLKAKYLIHAAVMAMDFVTDADKISQATFATLSEADDLGAEIIAFPAFGTGVGRFPPGEAAKAMISAVKQYLAKGDSGLIDIRFVLFNRKIYNKFVEIADEINHQNSGRS